jgi:hypothetical protein
LQIVSFIQVIPDAWWRGRISLGSWSINGPVTWKAAVAEARRQQRRDAQQGQGPLAEWKLDAAGFSGHVAMVSVIIRSVCSTLMFRICAAIGQ